MIVEVRFSAMAAGAFYFLLDQKVTKNQDRKKLPPALPVLTLL
jgi:hypothetical protein